MRTSAALLLFVGTLACPASGQVCRLSVAGLNQARRVTGPVHTECPPSIHTPPFGNWGVASNFGQIIDGHQFEGWCHESRVCDNFGSCRVDCSDGWYEWNSCTDTTQFRAPNCTLYNATNCTEQASTTGVNVHGSKNDDRPVSCPVDTNGDGVADSGGCRDLVLYSSGTNYMSLYELDPATGHDLVQTLYFPPVALTLTCTVWGCSPTGSEWLLPSFYDSPSSPAKVSAQLAVVVNSGTFINTGNRCTSLSGSASVLSAASYRQPVAPDSLASAFGDGLAITTALPSTTPLPYLLGGTTVILTDSQNRQQPARISYVSPRQVNFIVPAAMAPGTARLRVLRSDGAVFSASVTISTVAPGLFSANANGWGVAAGYIVRVASNGVHTYEPIYACGSSGCVARPISQARSGETLFLVLPATGIRNHGGTPVRLRMAGQYVPVTYAGPQGHYAAVDQINAQVPPSLRGGIGIVAVVGSTLSNTVTLTLQ
ncbi:MAG: hypothetical protein HUU41_17150 [Bryobacteraceae bacterium]|nr:hypothetical protein [Bryobacterales bacterium]MEB2361243.1 hypothetical protein [Bryobacterales bacterium]NUN02840.1 hypothetical protein [Bryobacteraceae bacterium]